jgi:branched-chain amino acid transport system substrate-binding protein
MNTATPFKTEGFTKAMESVEVSGDIFGNPPMRFSATQHLGSCRSRLSQLQNGRWKVVLDHDQFR